MWLTYKWEVLHFSFHRILKITLEKEVGTIIPQAQDRCMKNPELLGLGIWFYFSFEGLSSGRFQILKTFSNTFILFSGNLQAQLCKNVSLRIFLTVPVDFSVPVQFSCISTPPYFEGFLLILSLSWNSDLPFFNQRRGLRSALGFLTWLSGAPSEKCGDSPDSMELSSRINEVMTEQAPRER